MTEILNKISKIFYTSGEDNLSEDIFKPCLEEALHYDRAAGFFSSSALVTWASALPAFLESKDREIRLLVSQNLSASDLAVLSSYAADQQDDFCEKRVEEYFEAAIAFCADTENFKLRSDIFAGLLFTGKMKIKIAFMENEIDDLDGDYHAKMGVYTFSNGEQIAFNGSANESLHSHRKQGEAITVFKSTERSHRDSISAMQEYFQRLWENENPAIRVYAPTAEVIKRCVVSFKGGGATPSKKSAHVALSKWRHQDEALELFMENKRGILEMATGTGKTRTSLSIAKRLIETGFIDTLIIAMEGNDLLNQWFSDLSNWIGQFEGWLLHKNYAKEREIDSFLMSMHKSCLLTKSSYLNQALESLPEKTESRVLVIHDEAHELGAPGLRNKLSGLHQRSKYVLGLSATPDREYDDDGNNFISEEIGDTIFRFPIEEAIKRGVLCPFDYQILRYRLTEGDKKRIKNVRARQNYRRKEGNPMTDKEVNIEIARVYKTSEDKEPVFQQLVENNPKILNNTIIFVETVDFGKSLLPHIHQITKKYKTYFGDDEKIHLQRFSEGKLDCLISCHKLSQGIDIPKLENVILVSSSRAKLETIQRIGRCLRSDPSNPEKKALVVDFILDTDGDDNDNDSRHADLDRKDWLAAVSKTRREYDYG